MNNFFIVFLFSLMALFLTSCRVINPNWGDDEQNSIGGGGNPVAVNTGSAPVLSDFKFKDETTGAVYNLMTSPTVPGIVGHTYTLTGKITDVDGDISPSTTPLVGAWIVQGGDNSDYGEDYYYLNSTAGKAAYNADGTFSYTITESDPDTYQEQNVMFIRDNAGNRSNEISFLISFN